VLHLHRQVAVRPSSCARDPEACGARLPVPHGLGSLDMSNFAILFAALTTNRLGLSRKEV
jgi:hypothetical protein